MERRQFGVIGLGRFGLALATTLVGLGHDVIGVDRDEVPVQELADTLTQAIQFDAADERALRAAGIQDVDVAVVSIGENIEASLLVVMQLRELGVPSIVAKAVTAVHGRILEKLGVARVIFPERDMAVRVAHSLALPNVLDYVELSRQFSIVEVPAPDWFVGRTLRQLELRPRLGLMVIAITRPAEGGGEPLTTIAPSADETIRRGDILAVLGRTEDLSQLSRLVEP